MTIQEFSIWKISFATKGLDGFVSVVVIISFYVVAATMQNHILYILNQPCWKKISTIVTRFVSRLCGASLIPSPSQGFTAKLGENVKQNKACMVLFPPGNVFELRVVMIHLQLLNVILDNVIFLIILELFFSILLITAMLVITWTFSVSLVFLFSSILSPAFSSSSIFSRKYTYFLKSEWWFFVHVFAHYLVTHRYSWLLPSFGHVCVISASK